MELPYDPALVLPEADFNNYIHTLLSDKSATARPTGNEDALTDLETESPVSDDSDLGSDETTATPKSTESMDGHNQTLTKNDGIAYRSTTSPLLDLFVGLEKSISGSRL